MGNTARRILGILTLGGGFTGFVMLLAQLLSVPQPALGVVITGLFALLYAWGTWCGLRLLEGEPRAMKTSRIFWALQLPVLISPGLSYLFSAGSLLIVGMDFTESKPWMNWQLGARCQWSIISGSGPTMAGLNLFAAGVVLSLSYRLHLMGEKTPASP